MPSANSIALTPGAGPKPVLLPILLFAVAVFAAGCGGALPEPPATGTPPPPTQTPSPGPSSEEVFNVTITTTAGTFVVDRFETEFNRRRSKVFWGFYRDAYENLVSIPFRDLDRIDFVAEMPPELFDQAILGRETWDMKQNQAFEVRLYLKDGTQREFYAFVPKFRGERDGQIWEFSLSSHNIPFDYIEFDR